MSTITTINSTDLITNSRADINNNFANLNTDKMETSVLDTDTTLAANSDSKVATQKAVKAYVDAGGNQNASTTQKGIVEEATSAEAIAGTAAGATGARLFLNPSSIPRYTTQTFLNSGTYTTPTGLVSAIVECWGGGGSGKSTNGGGGGGGAYVAVRLTAAQIGSSQTVTIGDGGAAVTNANGNPGGNTTFGSLITAYGGEGGTGAGGGGGGTLGAGGAAGARIGGYPRDGADTSGWGFGGGNGGASGSANAGDPSVYGGGGGGSDTGPLGGLGGNSIYGGAGGGGGSDTDANAKAGGTSVIGGAGGRGNGTSAAVAGSVPGGGGGGQGNGSAASGAGGKGKCVVTEFYM